jgi:hypothetical protein
MTQVFNPLLKYGFQLVDERVDFISIFILVVSGLLDADFQDENLSVDVQNSPLIFDFN